jgi:hypothetical protein
LPLRLVFIDDLGREWLVRDGVVQEKKFTPLTLGDRSARFRVFDLKEPRIRKVYLFPKEMPRAVNAAALEVQFLEATTLERDPNDT